MKKFKEKLNIPDPHHPDVTARVLEIIGSMTPEEAVEFLEYRTPGVPEYCLGEPISKNGKHKTKEKSTQDVDE